MVFCLPGVLYLFAVLYPAPPNEPSFAGEAATKEGGSDRINDKRDRRDRDSPVLPRAPSFTSPALAFASVSLSSPRNSLVDVLLSLTALFSGPESPECSGPSAFSENLERLISLSVPSPPSHFLDGCRELVGLLLSSVGSRVWTGALNCCPTRHPNYQQQESNLIVCLLRKILS